MHNQGNNINMSNPSKQSFDWRVTFFFSLAAHHTQEKATANDIYFAAFLKKPATWCSSTSLVQHATTIHNSQWIGLRENLQESPMIFMGK